MQSLNKAIDNSFTRELRCDEDADDNWPNQHPRAVINAHYVRVKPLPLTEPRLVTFSDPFVTGELGLEASATKDPLFSAVFSGDTSGLSCADAWATPYALTIFGEPILAPDPATGGNGYGDGRALSFMELQVPVLTTTRERSVAGLDPALFAGQKPPPTGGDLGGSLVGFEGNPFHGPMPEAVLAALDPSQRAVASAPPPPVGETPAEPLRRPGAGAGAGAPIYRRWEFQWKGAGPTPFCRGADGRAVLRSSIREFLASEFMAACGIPTTRAVATVRTETETAIRPWYKGCREVMTVSPCAITTRVAPSFIRIGHFELWARRAARLLPRSNPDLARIMLCELLLHATRREFPDLAAAFGVAGEYSVTGAGGECGESHAPPEGAKSPWGRVGRPPATVPDGLVAAFLEASTRRISDMVCGWMSTGYVQSNFNSDNVLVGGRTMDYGPFGFVDVFTTLWIMWTGGGDKFGFFNQPLAAARNVGTLVAALKTVVHTPEERALIEGIPQRFLGDMHTAVLNVWRRKLGFPPRGTNADADEHWIKEGHQLTRHLFSILEASQSDFTAFWRRLSEAAADLPDATGGAAAGEKGHEHYKTVGKELRKHLDGISYKSTALTEHLERRWDEWLGQWAKHLHDAWSLTGSDGFDAKRISAAMKAVNPRYVPREHLLVEAYTAAEKGDFSVLEKLQRVLLNPFDDGTEEEQKAFDRLTPAEQFRLPGVRFMSCSS